MPSAEFLALSADDAKERDRATGEAAQEMSTNKYWIELVAFVNKRS
jgi:hypothetical protein